MITVGKTKAELVAEIELMQARELRLHDFLATAADFLWEMDSSLRFSYFSDRFTEVAGISTEQLLGKSAEGIRPYLSVDPDPWRRHLDDLAAHRPFRNFSYSLKQPTGRTVHLSISGQPVFDEQGTFRGYRGSGSDVTAMMPTEHDVSDKAPLLQAILDAAPSYISFRDPEGRFVFQNKRIVADIGLPPKDYVGKTMTEVHGPVCGPTVEALALEVLRTGKPIIDHEFKPVRAGGRTFRYSVVLVRNDDSKIAGVLAVGQDITEQKEAEAAARQSQTLLQTFLDASPATITMRDPSGRFMYVNESAKAMMAKISGDKGEYIGKTFFDIHGDVPGATVSKMVTEVLESGQAILDREIRPPLIPDSVQRYTISPVFDEEGDLLGAFAIGLDITERKRIESALRDSELRFRRLIDQSNQGIMLHRNQKALYANEAFVKLFGYDSEQEILDLESTQSLIDPEYWYPDVHDEIVEGRFKAHSLEYQAVRKDGSKIWVSAHSFLIDWEGEPTICTARSDISERKRTESLVAEQRNELARLNGQKDRFFSIIAHDLKSPFTALLGMTQLMSQNAAIFDKEKIVEYAAHVNDSGNRVFELLQNLLEWSRLQMDGARTDPEEIPLRELVETSIVALGPVIAEKGISLTNDVEEATVFADPNMIQTVIRNLVANSLKFTPPGGAVAVSAAAEREFVQITISDSGVGMSAAQMENVFAIDRKTSTCGTEGETGTGLGLPLCKDMVERNGGKFWIESIAGKGTKVRFSLPLAPAAT